MVVYNEDTGNNFRSPSPSASVHYESSYLKRMKVKPSPSLSSIQHRQPTSGTMNSSSPSVIPQLLQQGVPMIQNKSFPHNPITSTPTQSQIRIRSQSPIDMILNDSRRRSITPVTTPVGPRRLDDQKGVAVPPLPFYRSPSPTMSNYSSGPYNQRLQQPTPMQNSSIYTAHNSNTMQNGGTFVGAQSQVDPGASMMQNEQMLVGAQSQVDSGALMMQNGQMVIDTAPYTQRLQRQPLLMQNSSMHLAHNSNAIQHEQMFEGAQIQVDPGALTMQNAHMFEGAQIQVDSGGLTMQNRQMMAGQQNHTFSSVSPNPIAMQKGHTIYRQQSHLTMQNGQNMLTGNQSQAVPGTLTINADAPVVPVEALSPDSQDAFIEAGIQQLTISPSTTTEIRTHSASMKKKGNRRNSLKKTPNKRSLITRTIREDSREDDSNHQSVGSNSSRDNPPNASSRKAIKFDPKNPERYWTQLAIRVSSEILKSTSQRDGQILAEVAQMAIIQAGEVYCDASPETINLVASKASMAVLEAGGDARVAALATISILNASDDTPSTEEEIKKKMVELYDNAKDLMMKGYEDGSKTLTRVSEIASTKLKGIAAENIRKYHGLKLQAEAEKRHRLLNDNSRRSRSSKINEEIGFLDILDAFLNGPNTSRDGSYRQRSSYYERRRGYYGNTSDEESEDYGRRRRSRRSRSLSSSYSDDSREVRRRNRRYPTPPIKRYNDDDFSIDQDVRKYWSSPRVRPKSAGSVGSESSRSFAQRKNEWPSRRRNSGSRSRSKSDYVDSCSEDDNSSYAHSESEASSEVKMPKSPKSSSWGRAERKTTSRYGNSKKLSFEA